MVPLALLLTAAAVCCLPLQYAAAATLFEIDPWVIPPSNITYPPLATACPGDQIRFVWSSSNHGVFKVFNNATDTGACPANWSASAGVELAPLAGSGNITYTVQQQDAPAFWLACQNGQGRHCQRGQKLLVQAAPLQTWTEGEFPTVDCCVRYSADMPKRKGEGFNLLPSSTDYQPYLHPPTADAAAATVVKRAQISSQQQQPYTLLQLDLPPAAAAAAAALQASLPPLPPPDASEPQEVHAEYQVYLARFAAGDTLAQRWHRLAEKGLLAGVKEEWEDWQHEIMLQQLQAGLTGRGRGRGRGKRDEADLMANLDELGPRKSRNRRAPSTLQDYQVDTPASASPAPGALRPDEAAAAAAAAGYRAGGYGGPAMPMGMPMAGLPSGAADGGEEGSMSDGGDGGDNAAAGGAGGGRSRGGNGGQRRVVQHRVYRPQGQQPQYSHQVYRTPGPQQQQQPWSRWVPSQTQQLQQQQDAPDVAAAAAAAAAAVNGAAANGD
ncbi:hypothetical protein OEZ85_002700 [Tetradesmus obliquus]|uniref:Phytocyanin domain-containing protein n=1 Tax=Tetradesmus obliquus TaxID=3088 RepID=A0ABY8TYD1_TETOB|nr:hypothetical protein OEZ85_002700 [Tetradesmus obliquus]